MIRVERLVVPEEKSFCSTSSVRLLHCAHSRAMATPLIPPPITKTSNFWSCVRIWATHAYNYLDAACSNAQHYFRALTLGRSFNLGKSWFSKDLRPGVLKDGFRAGPEFRIDIWKYGVAHFNGFQFVKLLRRNLASGLKAAPGIQQRAELLQMGIKALFRVVAGGLGGDQELPVRRFQQQQFTADLLDQPRGYGMVVPQAAVGYLLHRKLGRVDMFPGPRRFFIQPDAVVALSAPRSF